MWALWKWGLEVSLINAYMMMRRYCKTNGLHPTYSHHDFNKKVGYALLDHVNEWPRRNRKQPPDATRKRKCTTPPPVTMKAPRFSADALCPNKGNLKKRLDFSLRHLPTVPPGEKGNHVCQLHRWANRTKTSTHNIPPGSRISVCHCKICGVNLCLRCYEIFHTIDRLVEQINTILSFK